MNISYYNNKFNFNNNINKISNHIKNKNLKFRIKPINNNYKSIDDIISYNVYNNQSYTNIIHSLDQNRNNYLENKYSSTNNIFLNPNENKKKTF